MLAQKSFCLEKLSERIESLIDVRDTLKEAMTNRPPPIQGLEQLSPGLAEDRLIAHLRNVFIANNPSIEVAKRILETGWAYAIDAYPDVGTYIRRSLSSYMTVDTEPATWILTGLAGVGKTATITALSRALGEPMLYQASEDTPPRPIRGGLFLTVPSKATNKTMTNELRRQLGMDTINSLRYSDNELELIKRELYRQGCLFMIVDESQVIANGTLAGAAFVNLIAHLRRFGIPVIVVGNYSMCHGIIRQHAQNRDRMLVDPLIIDPSLPSDYEYIEYLKAYISASGEILNINPERDAYRIHELTGGGKRALLRLACMAYNQKRTNSKKESQVSISLSDLEKTYGSSGFSNFRSDIEDLRKFSVTPNKLRQDLRNPFSSIGDSALTHARTVGDDFKAQVARAKLMANLSVAERNAIKRGEMEAPEFLPPTGHGRDSDQNSAIEPNQCEQPTPIAPQPIVSKSASNAKRPKRPKPTMQDALRTRDNF